jgi:hypothetical protein
MSLLQGVKTLFGNDEGFVAGLVELPDNYLTQYILLC